MTEFEETIKFEFKNKDLMENCLIHSSFANENKIASNERLEFLGDSVLNLITTNYLYRNFQIDEGNLSKMRAQLVSAENLSQIVDKLNLMKYLKTTNLNNQSTKVKGDLFEAILGAMYLDSGYFSCKKFVEKNLKFCKLDLNTYDAHDYKTVLQEIVQQNKKNKLKYVLISKSGPSHKPEFTVGVEINKKLISTASANAKKLAENQAAQMAIEILKEQKND